MARLVLMCGLPGSGKTTEAIRRAAELGAVRLSPDQWLSDLDIDGFDEAARERIESLQWRLAQELLSLGQSVVLENGFCGRSERDTLRLTARALGAQVELYFLDVETAVLIRRIEKRNAALPEATFAVTPAQLLTMVGLFERPSPDELALFD